MTKNLLWRYFENVIKYVLFWVLDMSNLLKEMNAYGEIRNAKPRHLWLRVQNHRICDFPSSYLYESSLLLSLLYLLASIWTLSHCLLLGCDPTSLYQRSPPTYHGRVSRGDQHHGLLRDIWQQWPPSGKEQSQLFFWSHFCCRAHHSFVSRSRTK